jgi:RNA polymerase sigma-70 factor (ECF subfamily)
VTQFSLEESLVSDSHPDPGEMALDNLQHQEVRQALERLKDDYRMVLILRFLSELSPEETAQVMNHSPGAVRVLQHRALAALRNLLQES